MSIVAQKNNMSYYERFQLETYGNILPAEKQKSEEYEYLNFENREISEWIEQQSELQQQQTTTE